MTTMRTLSENRSQHNPWPGWLTTLVAFLVTFLAGYGFFMVVL